MKIKKGRLDELISFGFHKVRLGVEEEVYCYEKELNLGTLIVYEDGEVVYHHKAFFHANTSTFHVILNDFRNKAEETIDEVKDIFLKLLDEGLIVIDLSKLDFQNSVDNTATNTAYSHIDFGCDRPREDDKLIEKLKKGYRK